ATDGQSGVQLWNTDGTEPGTVIVRDQAHKVLQVLPNFAMWPVGKRVIFTASTMPYGNFLWTSDGSEAGTQLLVGTVSSPIVASAREKDAYFFATSAAGVRQLWITDGTPSGTHSVFDVDASGQSSGHALGRVGTRLLFFAET